MSNLLFEVTSANINSYMSRDFQLPEQLHRKDAQDKSNQQEVKEKNKNNKDFAVQSPLFLCSGHKIFLFLCLTQSSPVLEPSDLLEFS